MHEQLSICYCSYIISQRLNWMYMLHGGLNAKLWCSSKMIRKIFSLQCLLVENRKKNIVAFFYTSQRLTVPSDGSDMKESLFKGIEIFLYSRVWSNSLVGPLLPNHRAKNVYNFPVSQSSLRMPFFF